MRKSNEPQDLIFVWFIQNKDGARIMARFRDIGIKHIANLIRHSNPCVFAIMASTPRLAMWQELV